METISKSEFKHFESKVKQARKLKGLPDLHHYDLAQYCQVLINGASVAQLFHSMQCSDRYDLVDSSDDGCNPAADRVEGQFIEFCEKYLGLELIAHGDPRGASFHLVVDPTLGDSWGSHEHLCVPCVDAYSCF